MKRLLFFLLLLPLVGYAEQRTVMEYGRSATVEFELYAADGTLSVSEVDAGTEVTIVCDGDGGTTATNDFVDEGFAYSLVLTAAELECAHVTLNIGATLNHAVIIETCGTPNAQHMNCAAGPYITGDTAQSGTSTTTVLASAEAFANDDLNEYEICLVEDQIAGDPKQCAIITDYVGSTDTATHQAFIGTGAASGTEYIVYPNRGVVFNVAAGVVDANVASYDNDVLDNAAIATDAIGAAELAADSHGASEMAANSIGPSEIADDAIDAAALSDDATAEIWAVSCEDQGGVYSCRETMSLLLSEAMGTCVYTSGTRTWVCKDPSGTETRFTLVYDVALDGSRTTSTPAPMTP